MRILLVAPMVPEAEGAGAIPVLLHAQLAGLRERHDVTLVAGMGDEPGEAEAARTLMAAGVDLHVADRRRPPPGLARWRRRWRMTATYARRSWPWRTVWFAAPEIQVALDRLAARRSFDVVAVEDSAMAVFRLPAGVPAVLTEHEVRRPRAVEWPPGRPRDWWRRALGETDWRRWGGFQRMVWQRFDRVQVFGERDGHAIASIAPELADRVRVNPFGLVAPPAAEPTREQPGTVLFVGNFSHPPNRDSALWLAREIMPAVKEREPSARLRIVGSAPPRDVRRLAGADVDVIADAPSVRPHLEEACVVVAPVRTGGGMRMKILYALASGKPVVTTSRGAEGYNGPQRTAPLVVADDADAIAALTAELLADARGRRLLGERGRAFALEHHSPAAWARRLETVYEEAREHPETRRG
jgi:glycosyltransferase involved in cell wall biosynthesis